MAEKQEKGLNIEGMEVIEVLFQKSTRPGKKIGNVDIRLNITDMVKTGTNSIFLRYNYLARYSGIGYIKVEGTINLSNVDVKRVMKKWESKEPDEKIAEIINTIYYFISPIAVTLSTSLGLPPASIPVIGVFGQNEKKVKA